MIPVGLDLSLTATGIATDRAQSTVKTLSVMLMGQRLNKILDGIADATNEFPDESVVYIIEDLPFTRNNAAGQLGMVHGVVHLWAYQCGNPILTVPGASLKKFATGKGNATKPDMRMSLYKRADIDLRDDNQVDAWWLWALGYELLDRPKLKLPATHTENLGKLKDQLLAVTSA